MVNHYEEYGTRRDWLDAITNALQAEVPPGEPSVKRAAVARQLKAMGLKRGGCTERQVCVLMGILCTFSVCVCVLQGVMWTV